MTIAAGTIKVRTPIVGANNPGFQVSATRYNDSLVVTGGENGSVLVRDDTQTDGWGWAARLKVYVDDYGAVGDGSTDDSDAFDEAVAVLVAAGGGVLVLSPGLTYKTTRITTINGSHITVQFNEAEILFQPTDPVTYDRAFLVHNDDGFSAERAVTSGAIAIGDTVFTGDDADDLLNGDWLMVTETGASVSGADTVYFDWVQVDSTAGDDITIIGGFRIPFPGTHGPVVYQRITNLVEGVKVLGPRIRTTNSSVALPAMCVGVARNTTIVDAVVDPRKGNGIATFRAAGLELRNFTQLRGNGQATEIASTVDLVMMGCHIGAVGAPADTSALHLDFGSAFFVVTGNHFYAGANIMINLECVHHGLFTNNTLGWVRNETIDGRGISGYGCQYVTCAHNILGGGVGSSIGIAFQDTSGYPTLDVPTFGNQIILNTVTNFATPYYTQDPDDLYVIFQPSDALPAVSGLWASAFVDPRIYGLTIAHVGTNGNLHLRGPAPGVAQIASINDANSGYEDLWLDGDVVRLNEAQGRAELAGALCYLNPLTPAALTGHTDDLTIVGIAYSTVVHLALSNNWNLTGIDVTGTFEGQSLRLYNISAFTLTLKHNTTSSSSNRFYCPGSVDLVLGPNASAEIRYDGTATRWRVS